jgi:uncharacterized integral membrane protein
MEPRTRTAPTHEPVPAGDERSDRHPTGERVRREGVGVIAGAVLLIAALLALVLLVAQNGQSARLHFLWFDPELSLAALVLATAVVAIVLDQAVGLVWRRRRRRSLDLRERRPTERP